MKAKSCQISLLFLLLLVFSSVVHADTNIVNIYDLSGNLVTGDGNYYEYNEANQLVKVRQGDQNGAVIAEYFYDYSGQRVKKIENGVTTYYVSPHFEKQVGGAEAGDSKYYFADGERVAKKDPAGNVYYYHSDHLGGVNAVTDSAGTVVAKTDYMPFGDVKQGSTGNEKYSYTGKEKDKTDLYYFESRYNSPMFRHFTQADTIDPDISDPQDLNRYSYVGNNPLSYVDYDGHKKKKKHLSKRERRAVALGLDPDKNKKWVGKLSEREFRSLTLGLDPDKHKKKVGKMSNKEYKLALIQKNVKSKPIYNLTFNNEIQGQDFADTEEVSIEETSNRHRLTSEEKSALMAQSNRYKAQAAYYGALAKGFEHTSQVTKKATLGAIVGVSMLYAAPVIGAKVGLGYLGKTIAVGIGDIAAEYNGDDLSKQSMDTVHGLLYLKTVIELTF